MRLAIRPILPALALVACAALAGCATVKVEPIHITVDVNIKVDRALDEFFAPTKAPAAAAPPPAPAPAATTTAP